MALASTFDATFAKHAGDIPVGYLRALAYKESGFNPRIVNPGSSAVGLFQITSIALKDYNQRRKTSLRLADLADPEVNTRVAADHIRNVIALWAARPSLARDWKSRRWVELLTFGWNAGHNALSELAARLEGQGLPPASVTADAIHALAVKVGGSAKYLAEPKRLTWAKSVASLYLGGQAPRAPGAGGPLVAAASMVSSRTVLWGAAVVGGVLVAQSLFGDARAGGGAR